MVLLLGALHRGPDPRERCRARRPVVPTHAGDNLRQRGIAARRDRAASAEQPPRQAPEPPAVCVFPRGVRSMEEQEHRGQSVESDRIAAGDSSIAGHIVQPDGLPRQQRDVLLGGEFLHQHGSGASPRDPDHAQHRVREHRTQARCQMRAGQLSSALPAAVEREIHVRL